MQNYIVWNQLRINAFVELANLSDEEMTVFLDLCKFHRSRVWISFNRNMSTSTVDRIIRKLKDKYDSVQPHAQILPAPKIKGR